MSSDSECERREEFVLKVSVLKCECENNGVCRMESGEVRCVCEEGYHGELGSDRQRRELPLSHVRPSLSEECLPAISLLPRRLSSAGPLPLLLSLPHWLLWRPV